MRSDLERPDSRERTGVVSLLVRLYWMLFGVIPVVAFTSQILAAGKTFGWADVRYGGALLAMIAARWIDLSRFGGTRADGSPATRNDLIRYAVIVLVAGSLTWLAVRLLAARP